jgi:hypothetical protein
MLVTHFIRYGLTEFLLGHIESAGGVSNLINSLHNNTLRSTIPAYSESSFGQRLPFESTPKGTQRDQKTEWVPVDPGERIYPHF